MVSPGVQDRIVEIVRDTVSPGAGLSLDADTQLLGGGLSLDSVAVLELLLALEQAFDLEMDTRELLEARALRTVGALAAFISAKTGNPS